MKKLTNAQQALVERLKHDRLYLDGGGEIEKIWVGGGAGPSIGTIWVLVDRNVVRLEDCGLPADGLADFRREVVLVEA